MTSQHPAQDTEQAAPRRRASRTNPAAASVDAPNDARMMRVDAPQVTALSVAHLMDTPLQQLVDELAITVIQAAITEPGFTGYAYVDGSGVTVALPPGRPELEHDCMFRYLIGRAFNVDGLPPLPDPFRVLDLTPEIQHAQAAARRANDEGQGSR
ncbi:hypothetical protein [Streptomyces anthocyanicus]|uniref:hypothetical protein n=1 Tax=Streptomyces anthocyanicus TaxID=68174 RepID=UPI003639E1AB